jgi:hypothetical protein
VATKPAYPASRITLVRHPVKRHRRTPEEMQAHRDAIVEVLTPEHPATVRRVLYKLASHPISLGKADPKGELEYDKLGDMLCKMREDGTIPWSWIIDNTRKISKPNTWNGIADALSALLHQYRRDPWIDQEADVYILCEKDAIAGILEEETKPYIVPLAVIRGSSSWTLLHDIAMRILESGKPAYIFYLGDWDRAGRIIETAAERSIRHWAHDHRCCGLDCRARDEYPDAEIHWTRLGVNDEQIDEYNLQTREPKPSDVKHGWKGPAVEVDAMPMDVIRGFVRNAIESVLDMDIYKETMRREEQERTQLRKWIVKYGSK